MSAIQSSLYELKITGAGPYTDVASFIHRYSPVIISVNTATAYTIRLPKASLSSSDLTIVKLQANTVSVKVAPGDKIGSSSTGWSCTQATQTWASLVLQPVSGASKWIIVGKDGTWNKI